MAEGKIIRAGVMGWPIGHSLSPRLHGYWLDRYNIDGTYEPLAIEPGNLTDALRGLPDSGFAGVNLTVPHKEAAMAAVDEIGEEARRIGAVNTVVVRPDGELLGSNTDGFGFIENLISSIPSWTAKQGPAVILGAGGAARAVSAALTDGGSPELRLVNRTQSRAQTLAEHIGGPIRIIPWEKRTGALDGASLLVNATTLGMTGKPPLELEFGPLPTASVVADIVYAPLETDLLKRAAARGNPTVDGLGMLLHQARPGFAAWFGVEPKVTRELRVHVLRGTG